MKIKMNSIKLEELFNKSDLNQITKFINNKKWIELKVFLNEEHRYKELLKKGVIGDYLYYWLLNKFRYI